MYQMLIIKYTFYMMSEMRKKGQNSSSSYLQQLAFSAFARLENLKPSLLLG